MSIWQKNLAPDLDGERAARIIQKKKRKQDPDATGLSAVAIPRSGPRSVHQRNEDRHIIRGQKAKADIDGKIIEVSLLNLSSNGVMIETDEDFRIGDEIYLSIEDCAPVTTAVRWLRTGRVGLEFIAETVIIAEAGVQDHIVKTIRREAEASGAASRLVVGSERRENSKRHSFVFVAKLKWGKREATARLRNISSSGAMIAVSDRNELKKGDSVILSLRKAGELMGTVRWGADRELGIEFDDNFDLDLLIHEPAAELAPPDDNGGLASPSAADSSPEFEFDSLRVRLGNVKNPHQPPDMEYARLTLDEVYATLHPKGREPEAE